MSNKDVYNPEIWTEDEDLELAESSEEVLASRPPRVSTRILPEGWRDTRKDVKSNVGGVLEMLGLDGLF